MFWKRKNKIKAFDLNKENFNEETKKNRASFVFFEAPWCGACKILHPILNDLADENKEKEVLIATVNTSLEKELAQKYEIMSLPTLIIFKNGEILQKGSGMVSKPRLQEMVDKFQVSSLKLQDKK